MEKERELKGVCACTHLEGYHISRGPCTYTELKYDDKTGKTVKCVCQHYKEITMPDRNPAFRQLMDELVELHNRKSHDYAADDNVYSNFEFAATFANVTVLQVFDVLIGVKQARINELIRGKNPKNESLLDSLKDFVVYSALRACYYTLKYVSPEQQELNQ